MILALLLLAATPTLPTPTRAFPVAEVVSVYDGDTATVVLDLGLDVQITKTVRVFGIDTPEVRPLATREAGYRARDWLRDRLAGCRDLKAVTGTEKGRPAEGKYGRLLVTFTCDGADLTREMIDLGLGVPYFGGTK